MATNVIFDPILFIQVTVEGAPLGVQLPNINTVALFTVNQPSGWAGGQTYAIYRDSTQVGIDFGTGSSTYAMASKFFAQVPNPLTTDGYLAIVPLVKSSVIIQDLTYQAVTYSGLNDEITVAYTTGGTAGSEVVTVVGNAISIQIQSGVSTATQIHTAFVASAPAIALATCTISGTGSHTQTAPVAATNLTGGNVQDAIAANILNVYFKGVLVDQLYTGHNTTLESLATYCASISRLLFVPSSSIADFQTGGILYNLQQATQHNARGLYYNDGVPNDTLAYAAAYASLLMSTDFTASNTTKTMDKKPLVGFTPDQTLNQTTLAQATAAGVDVYVSVGGTAMLVTSGTNGWADEIYGDVWLQLTMQNSGLNFLVQTNTKIPQTEVGMTGLKNAYRQVAQQAVLNGFAAPGQWTAETPFGDPAAFIRNISDVGYYIYSLPVSQQSEIDRQARKAPAVQMAIKLAGAVQYSNVIVQTQQ